MKLPRIATRGLLFLALASSLLLAQSTASKPSQTNSPAASSNASSSKTPDSQKVDINSATKAQLDALPGIGAAYSQKIIDGRPYNSKRDLLTRKIVPQSTYDGIQDKIIAHHVKSDAGANKSTKSSTGTASKPQ
jgi:DNA uptake protein ComE-like DNA-binding protein